MAVSAADTQVGGSIRDQQFACLAAPKMRLCFQCQATLGLSTEMTVAGASPETPRCAWRAGWRRSWKSPLSQQNRSSRQSAAELAPGLGTQWGRLYAQTSRATGHFRSILANQQSSCAPPASHRHARRSPLPSSLDPASCRTDLLSLYNYTATIAQTNAPSDALNTNYSGDRATNRTTVSARLLDGWMLLRAHD